MTERGTDNIAPGRQLIRRLRNPDTLICLGLFLIVFISKAPVFDVPYYWDETIWVSGAYWLSETNLARVIPGFHPPPTFDFHPPILHFTLAVLFKLFGQSISLSHSFMAFLASIGVCFTYLLGKHLFGRKAGIFAALFLFFSPMYFTQSVMFLGDLAVAATGVSVLYFALKRRYLLYVIFGSYLALIKETSLGVIVPLLAYFFLTEWRKEDRKTAIIRLLKFSVPLFVMALFLIAQKVGSGYFSHLDAIKPVKTVTWETLIKEYQTVIKWLFYYQYRILFVSLIILNLALVPESRRRKELILFLLVLISSGVVYFVLFFLPRYLLPILPILCLTGAWSLMQLVKNTHLQNLSGIMITLMLVSSLSGGISYGTSEWNMSYLDAVKVQKEIGEYLQTEHPEARVLTSGPQRKYLLYPYLGFVTVPLKVVHFYGNEEAFERADLILVSEVPGDRLHYRLRDYAKAKRLHLLKRAQLGPFVSEVYLLRPQRKTKNAP